MSPKKVKFDLTSNIWSIVGTLNKGMSGHQAIYFQRKFWVVGERARPELCSFFQSGISCRQIGERLGIYRMYPELFPINQNYCMN